MMPTQKQVLSAAPYGLLGRTLGHSWSTRIHTMLGSAPYGLFEREPNGVEDFVRNGHWKGINVTIPYKRRAAELADVRTSRVDRLGVANTLVHMDDGRILADNTDVLGFGFMLERFSQRALDLSPADAFGGHKALVLGSGGACQAVRAALEDVGAKVVVISRTGKETYETLVSRHADAHLIVNTTPVGMYPNCPASPITEAQMRAIKGLRAVLDVVYNPERTGLCLLADRLGIPCESGLAMLVAQALYASELFQGTDLDVSLVQTIEDSIRTSTRNVVFIGMPGCGKTGAGRRLARMVGRPFVDLDDSFVVDHGETPAECILSHGEETFRALETETAGSYGSRSGLVIACGGGIVTQERNYELLHQNGTIVFLDRPLAELSSDNRPISQSKGVEQIARERMGLYRKWADISLACTGSAKGDALEVRKILGL